MLEVSALLQANISDLEAEGEGVDAAAQLLHRRSVSGVTPLVSLGTTFQSSGTYTCETSKAQHDA